VATPIDGPRGPARVAKPGLVFAARETGRPIVPIAWATDRAHVFGSWDRTVLPLPRSRIVIGWGAPLPLPEDGSDEALERARRALEAGVNALEVELQGALSAWRRTGRWPVAPQ
jgi:lysophospholipid acyltransferase (LPLAT)-like uncharacterized protein